MLYMKKKQKQKNLPITVVIFIFFKYEVLEFLLIHIIELIVINQIIDILIL